jgi:hypothetical protein
MYKNFINTSLNLNDYLKKNKNAPEGMKFCNGLCSKYLPKNDFFKSKGNCKDCYYLFLKVKKLVETNQITYEKFKENPSLVKPDKNIIPMYRKCTSCEEEKTIENFEDSRKECILCRKNKKKINYEEQFKTYIPIIENSKNDINTLTKVFRGMSADLVKLAMFHYKISIPHKERQKANMIVRLTEHFQSLLNPRICLGGCGFELETDFSVCKACKDKPKKLREQKKVEFNDNIDLYISELEDFNDDIAKKLTKDNCIAIAKQLNIKFYLTNKKYVIVEKIKEFFEEKKKKELLVNENKKDLTGIIKINDIVIESREDGMINATQLCKAGNKKFNDWYRLDSTKELINVIEDENLKTGIPVFKNNENILKTGIMTIESTKGRYGCSWIHPDLAVQLAQWISPTFALQVSRWTRELVI